MDAWQSEVHDAVVEVLDAIEVTVERSATDRAVAVPCTVTQEWLNRSAAMPRGSSSHRRRSTGSRDSAGCGAALKAYGNFWPPRKPVRSRPGI
ncbi:MAG: hypothetical protein CM1200mP26_11970 [Acidimicrobiales bacterium]|nr:MAG: hypothetical protein CM1200mP26_11970 [Acidimicrobiales bacterium]